MEYNVMEIKKVGEVYITPEKPMEQSRLLCDVLSDINIEQVAADECQNIDADSLAIRDVFYEGFIAGAKYAREIAKNFT